MSSIDDPLYQRAIDEAARKAAPLFEHFGWKYGRGKPSDRDLYVPDVLHLRNSIERLLRSVVEGGSDFSGSGRLLVQRHRDNGGPDHIHVTLQLAYIEDDEEWEKEWEEALDG